MNKTAGIAAAVALGVVLAGCGSSSTGTPGQTKGQKTLAKYEPAMTSVAADIAVVQVALAGLSASPPSSTLVDVATAAGTAHADLKAARDVFVGDLDLFTAASDLTASMGTLGDATGSPNNADVIAKFEQQYGTASAEWNTAVDKVAVAGGKPAMGKTYEVGTPTG